MGIAITVFALAFIVAWTVPTSGEERTLTKLPFTYILDYGSQHINSPEYIETIRQAPPTLLHLGKDVPFTHNWGPIQALGGENQAYGKRRPYAPEDYIRRLSAAEVEQRIADLTKLAADLHSAGVKWVTPYICSMTVGGHAEKRTGFWEFYDHWDEYKEFGLGERPKNDPITWMQRTPDGSLQFFYKFEGPFYPPYEPNIRYAACHNNPDWRYWIGKVTENVARCGFDGVFVDNAGSLRCYCACCKAKWRAWIEARYSDAERKDLFGAAQPDMSDGKEPGLLWAETRRFWNACIADLHQHIRQAGERVLGRPFLVFPNGGEQRPENVMQAFADTDLIMFERSIGPHGTNPGMAWKKIVEDVGVKRHNDNIFENKFVQCLERRVRPILLTRSGYPRSEAALEMNTSAAALGCAETAAFGGGGGFLIRLKPEWNQVQKAYRAFMEKNSALFEGLESLAEVALAVFPEQGHFGNSQHIVQVRRATQHLLDGHVLFDYVIEDQFTYERLKKYAAIVLPYVEYISDARVEALKKYVREGGAAVVIGQAGDYDEKGRRRKAPAFDDLLERKMGLEGVGVRRVGQGVTVYAERLNPQGIRLVEWLDKAAARRFSIIETPPSPPLAKVRVNAFKRPDGRRFVLHFVNYNVPLGVDAPPPEPIGPIAVGLRIPLSQDADRATCYDPQGDASPLTLKSDGKTVRFELPSLRVHRIVEIRVD